MPRNKKNKGNSGPTPVPNNNKAKSPAETKVIESPVASVPIAVPKEADTSNDDLKLRLANAKERLNILQEVIGGIADPTDVEKLKASGIDAAKEKLNIIQDSVDSVKTTLLQVREETARSVTPEGSQSGTNKKRKNKKHQNQNPPQGIVVAREQPSSDESKSKPGASENEGSGKEDGTATLSKKKRNRNRNKNKGQQEKVLASEPASNVADKTEDQNIVEKQSETKVTAPQPETQKKEIASKPQSTPQTKENTPQPSIIESKENSPETNKSKNNKKNNKKGQQKPNTATEIIESSIASTAEVKPTDLKKSPIVEVKPNDSVKLPAADVKPIDAVKLPTAEVKPVTQPPSNDKNKNKKNKNKNAETNIKLTEKSNESTEERDDKSEIQGDSKTDNISTDVSRDKQAANLKKEDSPSPKENQKKTQNNKVNPKDSLSKDANNQRKGNDEKVLPTEVLETTGAEALIFEEPPKLDSPKNKKDKKKCQNENKPNKVNEKLTEVSSTVTLPKDESIIVDKEPLKADATKEENNKNLEKLSESVKSAEKIEKSIDVSTVPVEGKKDSDCSQQQSAKNKKNKQQVPKTEQKPVESLNQSEALISKETKQAPIAVTVIQKEEVSKIKDDAPLLKSSEKQQVLEVTAPPAIQSEAKADLVKVNEIIKANESKAVVAADSTPSLPKLDFSQVVKDNKDKIPLMEIKALPVLAAETVAEANPTDSAIKSEAKTDTLLTDAVKDIADVKIPVSDTKLASKSEGDQAVIEDIKPIVEEATKLKTDVISPPTPIALSKPKADALVECPIEPKANSPSLTDCEAGSSAKQNKAKTPERKGNQVNLKNDQKKPQQVKGQNVKQKQNDPKSQANKKEDAKVDTEVKEVTEKVVPENVTPVKEILEKEVAPEKSVAENVIPAKVVTEKVETKLGSPAATLPVEEKKIKEDSTKKTENIKQEQGKQKPEEKKLEVQAPPQSDSKDKAAAQRKIDSTEKQLPISQEKADKKDIKKSDAKANASTEPQKKDSKPESSQSQTQKPETKAEMSKKDQKKQNKMKGKAPQPPDIPMDMSLLSVSMIDPAADEAISQEESEDQSSLIAPDSKNVAGSGFVQSVDSSSRATADPTKSLEPIQTTPKNDNKVTEIERETKSSSPSSNKRNKDMANLKESVEMQETKSQELPEKSAQQKMEPVKFPPVQLLDILEAKMTSPTVKPGNVAGNVRKLPKDTKRTDQLNVQQQKSRSKSPKENLAEKYVKNQQLASGDNKKQATQNLKNEILKTEVGALVTSLSKEKEVKEPANTDANLTESKVTPGTTSITAAVTDAEQVANSKESDAISKQKAEPLPKNTTISEAKLQQSKNDGKTTVAAGGKNETKPKIAPKPNVASKAPAPKVADRSKQSPVKSSDNKTPGKDSPTKETVTPSKASVQTKATPPSKSPVKQSTQTKLQTQASSPTTAGTPSKSSSADSAKKPEVPPKPILPKTSPNNKPQTPVQDEDEEFVEYKFTPRPVFIATACQICKVPLDIPNPCKQCQMVSYCSDEHQKEDQASHVPFCAAIQEIAKKRGGHIYNNCRILNDDDYRSLRVHTLNLCENFLKRHLMPFEREMLLFPRLCCTSFCREWRQQSLIECKQCGQVSYCAAHPEHLQQDHEQWCNSFDLYQKIVLRQKNFGRIEPSLPSKIMLKHFDLSDNIDNVFKILYKNYGAIKDECIYATLTQLATAPLTALYGSQKNQQEIGEVYTIHLVGAELQFEADTLDKWETFFLHLVPTLVECRVVFVGPELNAENLPLEILSRIRMCRTCRQNCRIVKFDFQCGTLYHDYVNSSAFTKPDLICFFNPGLYRSTGFNGLDTWPNTIKSATSMNCPIVVTSYTEIESPRDLERIQKESDRPLTVVQSPQINPFASQRPERNFISDEVAPMIFKNYFCFCVK